MVKLQRFCFCLVALFFVTSIGLNVYLIYSGDGFIRNHASTSLHIGNHGPVEVLVSVESAKEGIESIDTSEQKKNLRAVDKAGSMHPKTKTVAVAAPVGETSTEGTAEFTEGSRVASHNLQSEDCQSSSIRACCEESIRNPPETIDIVIPYKYREETDVSLMYELRSFEKSGLLDHVGKVFIMTNSNNETQLLEARYQRYLAKTGIKQLHIIAMDEITVPFKFVKLHFDRPGFVGRGLVKTHYAPFIPQLSSYYLLLPDDNVMLRNYTRDIWFDSKRKLPYAHSFGAGGGMNAKGFGAIAEMHGPNFLNRCSMKYVIQKYNVTHPTELSPTAVALGMMKREKLLSGFFGYHSSAFRKVEPHKTEFFRECHTNGGCRSPEGFREIFVNVQGNGISIEYKTPAEQIQKRFMAWFKESFPQPSRFE